MLWLQQGRGEFDLFFLGVVVGGGAGQLRAAHSLVFVLSRESGGASGREPGALRRGRHGSLQQG